MANALKVQEQQAITNLSRLGWGVQVSVLTIDTTDSGCYTLTMPHELRIEYPGAIYHVLNRGDQRDDIFLDDEDRRKFLAALEECCGKTGLAP